MVVAEPPFGVKMTLTKDPPSVRCTTILAWSHTPALRLKPAATWVSVLPFQVSATWLLLPSLATDSFTPRPLATDGMKPYDVPGPLDPQAD